MAIQLTNNLAIGHISMIRLPDTRGNRMSTVLHILTKVAYPELVEDVEDFPTGTYAIIL